MDSVASIIEKQLSCEFQELRLKPIDPRLLDIIAKIEARPAIWIGNDKDIRAVFHFLNGWQCAMGYDERYAPFNRKLNLFLALHYHDFDVLNWASLLLRHEGENSALRKFFEFVQMIDNH